MGPCGTGGHTDISGLYLTTRVVWTSYQFYGWTEVAVQDGPAPGQLLQLKEIIYNFMRGEHPYQAIDDMAVTNENCPW